MAARDGAYSSMLFETPEASVLRRNVSLDYAAEVITVIPPQPTVTSASPLTMELGQDGFVVTVVGTGFVTGMTCDLGDELTATVTFNSSTSLTVTVDTTGTPVSGSRPFFLVSPHHQQAVFEDVFVVSMPPAPVITSVVPDTATIGFASIEVAVVGENFVEGMTAELGDNLAGVVTFIDSENVTVLITPVGPAQTLAVPFTLIEPEFGQSGTWTTGVFSVTGGTTEPTVSDLSPAAGTPIRPTTPVSFKVTDVEQDLFRVFVTVRFPGQAAEEVAFDGYSFTSLYSASTETSVSEGFQFTLRRTGGWAGPPTIRVFAFDRTGNEL